MFKPLLFFPKVSPLNQAPRGGTTLGERGVRREGSHGSPNHFFFFFFLFKK